MASLSTPAKTVYKFFGVFSLFNDIITPGLAFAAAQPQTEFTIITDVSSSINFLISSSFDNSTNPLDVNSNFIGFTTSSGYIILFFQI